MRSSRLIILAIALVAGASAFLLVRNLGKTPGTEVVEVEKKVDVTQVLVAARNLRPGTIISRQDIEWQEWPQNSSQALISKEAQPDAIETMTGSVVRSELVEGEPLRTSKVVSVGKGGYLSAVLPSGKRAISTAVSPETGAGGFILPNDRVDVIMTRRQEDPNEDGREIVLSETVLKNARVLAIDQTVEEQNGESVVVGSVATLELDPAQAETLALAQRMGELSLALRSILDGKDPSTAATGLNPAGRGNTVKMVRFGVSSQVTSAQ